jgi:transcriptional regulator GlxA family with amidase domain
MDPKKKRVWILVAPGTGLMNLCAAWEVFSHANDVSEHAAYDFGVFGPLGPQIVTGHGLLVGDVQKLPRRFKHAPDTVIVAGGSAFTPASDADLFIAKWLARHASRFRRIVSICAGAFTLGEAGLLDGRKATTHWMALDRLREGFPKANVVDEGIFVKDGPIWTSAGITAGIDLCLALVESDHGHRMAMDVAQRLVLFLRRSGNQAQFSAALERQTSQSCESGRLAQLSALVLEHINGDLRVPRLARHLGMSPRTLTRWCQTELGESPAQVVRRLRIEEAGRLLNGTRQPLKAIAVRSGLGDASTLWRHFVREYGVSPEEYRARFSSALD